MLSKNGYFVNLYERTDDILKSASGINQYRLHRGYHYPRSYETAISSKEGQNGFLKYYGESILKEVENYYCIAKDESLVDKDTYIKFLDKLQLEYKEVDVDLDYEYLIIVLYHSSYLFYDQYHYHNENIYLHYLYLTIEILFFSRIL